MFCFFSDKSKRSLCICLSTAGTVYASVCNSFTTALHSTHQNVLLKPLLLLSAEHIGQDKQAAAVQGKRDSHGSCIVAFNAETATAYSKHSRQSRWSTHRAGKEGLRYAPVHILPSPCFGHQDHQLSHTLSIDQICKTHSSK